MKNKELSKIFDEIADALELKGGAFYKIVAYRRVSRVLDDLTEDVEALAKEGRLREIHGVGEGIAKKIEEYLATGRMKKHQEALSGMPRGFLALLKIQNLGPKTLALAHRELGVKSLDDLVRVVEDGSLARLTRMGKQRVENIKKGIETFLRARERIPIYEAAEISDEILSYMKTLPGVKRVTPAGSLRRMRETVGDIDILATGDDGEKIVDFFEKYPEASRVLASGKTKGSIVVRAGRDARQVDLRAVPDDSYGAALQYFTGSKAHNIRLRSIAKEKGMKISEYGVFKGDEKIAGRTEEEVYEAVGLPYIPPELREDRGEVEAALSGKLPRLLEASDINGDLHVHSTYSDGRSTIEEIAEYARSLGYEYVAICDHSKSAKYARGLSEEALREEMDEIDGLNRRLEGMRVLKGSEVDILSDGTLDFSDELLGQLDVVVAAVHTGFKKNVTERFIAAIENPHVDVIAHPTGRLISKRRGYEVDLGKVMEAAKEHDKVLELNAYYDRLDLSELQLRRAKEMGIRISIDTDAHSVGDMRWMRFGVGMARRGWLEKGDVVNALSCTELLSAFK
jgi:DNA polymerase (family 10)